MKKRIPCPICGKMIIPRRDGSIRKHGEFVQSGNELIFNYCLGVGVVAQGDLKTESSMVN